MDAFQEWVWGLAVPTASAFCMGGSKVRRSKSKVRALGSLTQ